MKNAFEIEYKKHEIPNFALRKSILQIPKIDLHSTGSGFFLALFISISLFLIEGVEFSIKLRHK